MKKSSFCILAFAALSIVVATSARAQGVSAVTFSGGTNTNNGGGYTLGYSFTVNLPAVVTSLGYYDLNGAAFTEAHTVGLWNATGNLLGSASVLSTSTLADSFRYVTLTTPLVLLPGQTYTVGGTSGLVDNYIYTTTNTAFNPNVKFVANEYSSQDNNGETLAFPTITEADVTYGFFGGSFQLLAVPEPSSVALTAVAGLAGVGLMVRRARQQRA